jgi:hypothetical protein
MEDRGTMRISKALLIRLPLLLSVSCEVQAQDNPNHLIMRVSQKILDSVNRLPKYVCTLTVDRAAYETGGGAPAHTCDGLEARKKGGHLGRLFTSDRLRLDVAIGASHETLGTSSEMYSWVGENHFDNQGLFDLVRQGAISSGSFSTLLASIFGEDRASFSYNGERTVDGRVLAEFAFLVPLEKSNYLYLFENNRRAVRTPMEGTVLADAKTYDLVRLTIHRTLPAEADACATSQTLDYGRVSFGDNDFLLVKEGRLDILSRNDEMVNHLGYSACHEFTGESTLTFDPPLESNPSIAAKGDAGASGFALPPGLPFQLLFLDPIDTTVAAAGDPIRARLAAAIRAPSSEVLVPPGAMVLCRIMKARRSYGRNASFELAVKVESVVVGGKSQPFNAAPDSGSRTFAKGTGRLRQRVNLGRLSITEDRGAQVFVFRDASSKYIIKSGLVSNWLTLAPIAQP